MAVAFDAVGPSSAGSYTASVAVNGTATWTHAVGTSAKAIVVAIAVGASTTGVTTTAKIGTTTIPSLGVQNSDNATNAGYVQLFGLINPPTGTQTITITVTGAASNGISGGSVSFTGAGSFGTLAKNYGSGTAASVPVTPAASGNMLTAAFCSGSTGTLTMGQTARWTRAGNNSSAAGNGGQSTFLTTGTTAVSMTATIPNDWWGMVGVEVKAGTGGATNWAGNATPTATSSLTASATKFTVLQWAADLSQADVVAAGFENDSWNRETPSGTDAASGLAWPIAIGAAPGGRSGRAIPFVIPAGSHRYEVVAGTTYAMPGDTWFYGDAFYLGTGFPTGGATFQVIQQWRQSSDTGSPVACLEVRNGQIRLSGAYGVDGASPASQYQYDVLVLDNVQVTTWYNVVTRITNFSATVGQSKIDVWVNGTQLVTNYTIPCATIYQADASDVGTYWKQGIYHDTSLGAATIYHAAAAQGGTYAAVDPTGVVTQQGAATLTASSSLSVGSIKQADAATAALVGAGSLRADGARVAQPTDAVQQRVYGELSGFTAWLTANGAQGFIGEFGVLSDATTADQLKWNALLEGYLEHLDGAGLSAMQWASGRYWGPTYPLGLYVNSTVGGDVNTATSIAGTLEAHPQGLYGLRGTNVAGLDEGTGIAGGGDVRTGTASVPTLADFAYLASRGVKTVRLPIAWERLQPSLQSVLSSAFMTTLDTVLGYAATSGIAVILDVHNYCRYTNADGSVTTLSLQNSGGTVLGDLWTRLATWVTSTSAHPSVVIGYGLQNEPHDLPTGPSGQSGAVVWQQMSQTALTAIRTVDTTRTVYVAGYQWSAADVWPQVHPAGWITDSASNFRYEAHHYWDSASALGARSGTYQQTTSGGLLTYATEQANSAALITSKAPQFAALQDTFDASIDKASKWSKTFDPGTASTVVNGRARVYADDGPLYAGIQSALSWTLANSHIGVQVPTVPGLNGDTGTVQATLIVHSASQDAGTRLSIAYRADLGQLQFRNESSYYDPSPVAVTYSAAVHQWWRIAHDGSNVLWQTSSDGAAWTTQRTVAGPAWAYAGDSGVVLEAWRTNGTPDFAEFDNVNVTPSSATLTASSTASALVGVTEVGAVVPMTAAGQVVASGSAGHAAAAVLTAAFGMTARPSVMAAATLPAVSSLSATPTGGTGLQATLTATSQLSAIAMDYPPVSALLVAAGQVAASALVPPAAATLTATSSSTAAVTATRPATPLPLVASSTITTDGVPVAPGAASLVGTSSLTAGATRSTSTAATLTATFGATIAAPALAAGAASALTASSALTAQSPTQGQHAAATLTASSALTSSAIAGVTWTGSATSSLTAGAPALNAAAASTLTAFGLVAAADGRTGRVARATLVASSAVNDTAWQTERGASTLVGTSTVVATAWQTESAHVITLAATFSGTFTSTAGHAASVSLVASTTITAGSGPPTAPGQAQLVATFSAVIDARSGHAINAALTGAGLVIATADSFTPVFPEPYGPPVRQTPTPELTMLVADTMTGKVAYELPFSVLSWDDPINAAGNLTATLPIEATLNDLTAQGANTPAAVLRAILGGSFRYSLAVCWGWNVLWAGPYQPATIDPDKATIEIAGTQIEKIFERRVLLSPNGTGLLTDASWDLVIPPTNPFGTLYQVIANAVTGDYRYLPISCNNPPNFIGDTVTTYYGYDLNTAWKAASDIIGSDGGPDMRFEPYLVEGTDGMYLMWNLNIGDPYCDAGTPWTWDDTNSRIQVDYAAQGLATRYFVSGSGQDRLKVIGEADTTWLTDLGFPALDGVDSNHSSETDQYNVDSFALADIYANTVPSDKWTLKIPIDSFPPGGSYRAGDVAHIAITDHPVLAAGVYTRRITDVSGDASQWVQLIAEPIELDWQEADRPVAIPAGSIAPVDTSLDTSTGSGSGTPPSSTVGGITSKVRDLTGPGESSNYAVGGTDLGVTALSPDGRLVSVFGDTFADYNAGGSDWRAPVILYGSATNFDNGIDWTGCVGSVQSHADQVISYTHNAALNGYNVTTMIPSDIITIGSTMYLHVAAMNGYPTVSYSAVYQSTNNGATWTAVPGLQWDSSNRNGYFQQITWENGGDGYVYIYSTGSQRTKGIILLRAPVATFTNVATWQDWVYANNTWAWTSTVPSSPSVILPGSFGEQCLRLIGDQWVWCCFDAGNYRIDMRKISGPTDDLTSATPTTLATGVDWSAEDHTTGKIAQLYGGFIVPGSTLDDLHIIISQWNTSAGWPYRAMQFKRA